MTLLLGLLLACGPSAEGLGEPCGDGCAEGQDCVERAGELECALPCTESDDCPSGRCPLGDRTWFCGSDGYCRGACR